MARRRSFNDDEIFAQSIENIVTTEKVIKIGCALIIINRIQTGHKEELLTAREAE